MFAAGKTSSGVGQTYVDDVFSTWLYDGNGTTQTINNGIDLAGKGGMVWIKERNTISSHSLFDTTRGSLVTIGTNNTDANFTLPNSVTAFNANGFSVGNATRINSTGIYASWTFRKAPKFFDVVTYTGNGVAGRQIAHSLGVVPGMIVTKQTDVSGGNWWTYHVGLAATNGIALNTTSSFTSRPNDWNSTDPTDTYFTLGSGSTNDVGVSYVAYLFANDTSSDGIIQCGLYTGNDNTPPTINLGWEPQFLIIKGRNQVSNWALLDSMLGMSQQNAALLSPNTTGAESTIPGVRLLATGFTLASSNTLINSTNVSYIYVAIRRPNKPPTTGTQVFMPTVYTGTNVNNRLVDTTIAPDMVFVRQRNDATLAGMVVGDRLRGQPYLLTGGTAAEVTSATALDQQLVSATEYGTAFSAMNGFWVGTDATAKLNVNTTASNHIAEAFKRAPGVFDVVCYTGVGTTGASVAHQLGVAPELMIIKQRGGVTIPYVYVSSLGNTNYLELSSTAAVNGPGGVFGNTTPTASNFYVSSSGNSGASGLLYVAYLFATSPGISKVFSYTGNGSSQTINCGFTTGARFVLIKRTDNTGDWWVWDSARGIVAGSDPVFNLNSTNAENSIRDTVDTDSTGFIVNYDVLGINGIGATYIGLAFA